MIYRARIAVDLIYKADKPLTPALLTRITNRVGTYVRTGAMEGLEERADVLFDKSHYNQHAHHHDARFGPCSVDINAATDGLGPIE